MPLQVTGADLALKKVLSLGTRRRAPYMSTPSPHKAYNTIPSYERGLLKLQEVLYGRHQQALVPRVQYNH